MLICFGGGGLVIVCCYFGFQFREIWYWEKDEKLEFIVLKNINNLIFLVIFLWLYV